MIRHIISLMFEDGANVGCLEGNPVRKDLNEAGRMVGMAEFPGHPAVAVVPNANSTYFFNTNP